MKNKVDNYDKAVGETIKYLRNKANLTQTELGEKVGLTKRGISHYETGARSVSLATAKAISTALGMNIDDFVKQVEHFL